MSTNAARGRCTVVVGCQWGDEGKGKIVDVLAEAADIVARYQGGANAGHTVHVHGDEFILHQIPSGILHPGKRCLLGNGVVLDLPKFFAEYDALEERGIELEGRIGISQRAHLLLPYHRALDHAAEVRAREKIGTTGQGIGPAYVSKSGRRGVRVTDLGNSSRLERLVERAMGMPWRSWRSASSRPRSSRPGCGRRSHWRAAPCRWPPTPAARSWRRSPPDARF